MTTKNSNRLLAEYQMYSTKFLYQFAESRGICAVETPPSKEISILELKLTPPKMSLSLLYSWVCNSSSWCPHQNLFVVVLIWSLALFLISCFVNCWNDNWMLHTLLLFLSLVSTVLSSGGLFPVLSISSVLLSFPLVSGYYLWARTGQQYR